MARSPRRKDEAKAAKRQRQRIERSLPSVGTILRARRGGIEYEALIVSAPDLKSGRAIRVGKEIYGSLSSAARAITGNMVNGWKFWQIET